MQNKKTGFQQPTIFPQNNDLYSRASVAFRSTVNIHLYKHKVGFNSLTSKYARFLCSMLTEELC